MSLDYKPCLSEHLELSYRTNLDQALPWDIDDSERFGLGHNTVLAAGRMLALIAEQNPGANDFQLQRMALAALLEIRPDLGVEQWTDDVDSATHLLRCHIAQQASQRAAEEAQP